MFPDKQKLRKLITSRLVLQELLKGFLQDKIKNARECLYKHIKFSNKGEHMDKYENFYYYNFGQHYHLLIGFKRQEHRTHYKSVNICIIYKCIICGNNNKW